MLIQISNLSYRRTEVLFSGSDGKIHSRHSNLLAFLTFSGSDRVQCGFGGFFDSLLNDIHYINLWSFNNSFVIGKDELKCTQINQFHDFTKFLVKSYC